MNNKEFNMELIDELDYVLHRVILSLVKETKDNHVSMQRIVVFLDQSEEMPVPWQVMNNDKRLGRLKRVVSHMIESETLSLYDTELVLN